LSCRLEQTLRERDTASLGLRSIFAAIPIFVTMPV
jgi:hypothetical protein